MSDPRPPRREAFQSQTAYENACDDWDRNRPLAQAGYPDIHSSEIQFSRFRPSGMSLDSGVRLTHIPSGLFYECADGQTLWENNDKAYEVLKRLVAKHREKQAAEGEQQKKEPARSVPEAPAEALDPAHIAYTQFGIVADDSEIRDFARWCLQNAYALKDI